jgi:hypothetical protein
MYTTPSGYGNPLQMVFWPAFLQGDCPHLKEICQRGLDSLLVHLQKGSPSYMQICSFCAVPLLKNVQLYSINIQKIQHILKKITRNSGPALDDSHCTAPISRDTIPLNFLAPSCIYRDWSWYLPLPSPHPPPPQPPEKNLGKDRRGVVVVGLRRKRSYGSVSARTNLLSSTVKNKPFLPL